MASMKLAIIAFHFKPEEAIGAVRPENWAQWLSKNYDVTVISRFCLNKCSYENDLYKVKRPFSFLIFLFR